MIDDQSGLFYQLEAFGKRFDLHLTPNEDFIAPNLVVQHLDVNETWLSDDDDVGRHCFHSGQIQGDPQSVAAISVCNHLVSTRMYYI